MKKERIVIGMKTRESANYVKKEGETIEDMRAECEK